jgi:hypothetical protein
VAGNPLRHYRSIAKIEDHRAQPEENQARGADKLGRVFGQMRGILIVLNHDNLVIDDAPGERAAASRLSQG